MALRNGNLVRICRNLIPERLEVTHLFDCGLVLSKLTNWQCPGLSPAPRVRLEIGVRLAILRLSISGEIIRKVSRPHRPRVQTSALLGRLNLNVAKQNRAACSHDLGGVNAAEDTINKTYAVENCAGETGSPHHPRTGRLSPFSR